MPRSRPTRAPRAPACVRWSGSDRDDDRSTPSPRARRQPLDRWAHDGRAHDVDEQRRLTASLLASPPRVIQEAERLGLVLPPEPAQYLFVPEAPMPKAHDGSTAGTLGEWSKTKPSLGSQQP